jgi:hypothetical protein
MIQMPAVPRARAGRVRVCSGFAYGLLIAIPVSAVLWGAIAFLILA